MVLLVHVVPAEDALDIPDFGAFASRALSPEYERHLGQLFLKQLRREATLIEDPEIVSYIDSLGAKIAAHETTRGYHFKFLVIDSTDINAFAGPDSIIGINTGVILDSDNESELAAVIAHEIAHVSQHHLARAFEQAQQFNLPMAAALLSAIIVGINNPDISEALFTAITGLNAQRQINFTRENEKEADRIGIGLLSRAGFNPRAMGSFFEKLQRASRYSKGTTLEFLRTHPVTSSRISDANARAVKSPRKIYKQSHAYFLVRNRLRSDSFEKPTDAIAFFKNQLKDLTVKQLEQIAHTKYGLAHAYIRKHDLKLAQEQITYLLKQDEDDSAYLLLAARAAIAAADYPKAFDIYQQAQNIYPNYRPVVLAYAKALINDRRADSARKLLKNYVLRHGYDRDLYLLLGQAEAILGNHIETAIIQAQYYQSTGDTELAFDKLKFIRQNYELNYYQSERIDAYMQALEKQLSLKH